MGIQVTASFFIYLISGQALHEALIRQEEFLAYVDRQEAAKFRVRHHFVVYPLLIAIGVCIYVLILLCRERSFAGEWIARCLNCPMASLCDTLLGCFMEGAH